MKQIWKKHAAFSAGVMLAASALSGIPAAPVSAAELLTAEFETTNDSFTGRGGASVQWTSDESNEGTCSQLSPRQAANGQTKPRISGNYHDNNKRKHTI